ncbi:MAG: ATP-dependent zinc protease family protein [Thermodesulfobacteriota bacterium]
MSSNRGCFAYLKGRRINKTIFLILPFIITILSFAPLHAEDKHKTVIGAVEEVVLFPWGVKLPARIDTGAGMTSLDVRDLTIKNKVAQFRLPEKYGNVLIKLPVIRHCNIRSSSFRERRPVVEIELCVGTKRMRVQANLNNRSQLEYPIILGRDVLSQGFIVDSAQEMMLPPNCLEGVSQ